MRKIGLLIVVVLFLVACSQFFKESEEIRVRIIPNSNDSIDLAVKEEAKQYTICYLKEAYCDDYDVFKNRIRQSLKAFNQLLEKELSTACTVTFTKHTLYNKTYNDSAIRNKNTMTLYIILGNGEGSNWWGTVYPDFLQIESSEEVKYESLIVRIFEMIKGE